MNNLIKQLKGEGLYTESIQDFLYEIEQKVFGEKI